VPALWSTSLWGDVRRTASGGLPKRPRSGGGGGMTAGGLGPGDIMHDVVAKETELKRKLAAFASFNQTERDLLQTAFVRVGQEHRYGRVDTPATSHTALKTSFVELHVVL